MERKHKGEKKKQIGRRAWETKNKRCRWGDWKLGEKKTGARLKNGFGGNLVERGREGRRRKDRSRSLGGGENVGVSGSAGPKRAFNSRCSSNQGLKPADLCSWDKDTGLQRNKNLLLTPSGEGKES